MKRAWGGRYRVSRKKILLVDDDSDLLQLLKKRFQFAGYDCTCVTTVESALMALEVMEPHLVILDLGFQHASGTAFLQSAHRWTSLGSPVPPVIVLSGNTEKEIVELTMEMGAVAFLPKPYDTDVLLATVSRYLTEPR